MHPTRKNTHSPRKICKITHPLRKIRKSRNQHAKLRIRFGRIAKSDAELLFFGVLFSFFFMGLLFLRFAAAGCTGSTNATFEQREIGRAHV